MFFNTENPNRKHPKNTNKYQHTKKTTKLKTNTDSNNTSDKIQNIKREKIIIIIKQCL